jgi:thiamine biosynthesis protein ThiS
VKVVVNGEERRIQDGWTVADLISELELAGRPVAVERNREVVPRARFSEVRLEEGDRLEIVSFVGGG